MSPSKYIKQMVGAIIAAFLLSGCVSEKTGNFSGESTASFAGPSKSIDITANHATSDGDLTAVEATESVVLYPRVTISTDLVGITSTNLSSFEVRGICSENGQPVTVSMGGVNASPTCTNGAWITNINLSTLTGPSRSIDITANHATSDGDLTAVEATWIAFLYPRVTIATNLGDITSTNISSFEVRGTCSENGQPVTVSMGGVNASPTCTNGAWITNMDLSTLTGRSRSIDITANHATSDGNLDAVDEATGIVSIVPRVTIDTNLGGITSTNISSFEVRGTCSENGQPVTVSIGGVNASPTCTNGAWITSMDVTGLYGEGLTITAGHSNATGSHTSQTQTVIKNFGFCPDNYVRVPALKGYTTNDFCVMKYEAKNDGSGNAISQASGKPYVEINRDDSIAKCTSLGEGYDLITNDEWQSIARNIELVPDNWSEGVVGRGDLNQGHSDARPGRVLQAISDDAKGCFGTKQSCSNTIWDSQRRTHTLSNGEVIWDIAGNAYEWVRDNNESKYGNYSFIYGVDESHSSLNRLSNGTTTISRHAKDQFGPSRNYTTSHSHPPYGGLGYGKLNSNAGGIIRGGYWSQLYGAGVFMVFLKIRPVDQSQLIGFRCVFHPY